MARLIKPLTATQVQNAKPKDKPYKLFDGGGLFLQVTPAGGKHWKLKYRRNDGKEGMLSLGSFPDVTLEQARKKRDEARAQKAAGLDPGQVKQAEKLERMEQARNTFEAIAAEWLEVHKSKVVPDTIKNYERVLRTYVLPVIGKIPIKDLKAPAFLDVLRRLEALDRLCVREHVYSACSLTMRFAVATGRAEYDPLPSLRTSLKRRKPKHFAALTDPEDVGRLLRLIWMYRGTFTIQAALKIAPYVFTRPGELNSARWADIDFAACEWRYLVTKTNTPHIVPLAPQVMSILRELHPLTGYTPFVFPNLIQRNVVTRSISKNALTYALRAMGVSVTEMTPHGFRAIARTLLDEVLGERYELIEHQLAHKVRDPNGRAYNRTQHLSERHRMMKRWAVYLDNLREGKAEIPPHDVDA